jgi:hypothetical protein
MHTADKPGDEKVEPANETGPEIIGRYMSNFRAKMHARHVVLVNKKKNIIYYSLEQPMVRSGSTKMDNMISDLFKKESDFKKSSISSKGRTITINESSVTLPKEIGKHRKTAEKVLIIDIKDNNQLLIVSPQVDHNLMAEKIINTITTIEKNLAITAESSLITSGAGNLITSVESSA